MLGWTAIFCWHADAWQQTSSKSQYLALMGHLRHFEGVHIRKKPSGLFEMELRVDGFNAQEETVLARALEARHVEHGVMRAWQAIEEQHAEERSEGRGQHHAFERAWNK